MTNRRLAKQGKNFATKGGLGFISLDEAMEIFNFDSLIAPDIDEEEKEEKLKFLDRIDEIAEKYLNSKERCIYYLVIHEQKKTSEITEILNYNSWRTTQNSIERVFKMLKLYLDFEKIDSEDLEYEINRNFSKFERKVIGLLHDRLTIQQINNKLGKRYHYTKTHSLIRNILNRLADMGGSCRQYYTFLTEIRKFKDSCHFDEWQDKVRFIEGE